MTCVVLIDGIVAKALVTCHRNGTYTYHNGTEWVHRAHTVPRAVLEHSTMPEDERHRVLSHMDEHGVEPS